MIYMEIKTKLAIALSLMKGNVSENKEKNVYFRYFFMYNKPNILNRVYFQVEF